MKKGVKNERKNRNFIHEKNRHKSKKKKRKKKNTTPPPPKLVLKTLFQANKVTLFVFRSILCISDNPVVCKSGSFFE